MYAWFLVLFPSLSILGLLLSQSEGLRHWLQRQYHLSQFESTVRTVLIVILLYIPSFALFVLGNIVPDTEEGLGCYWMLAFCWLVFCFFKIRSYRAKLNQ